MAENTQKFFQKAYELHYVPQKNYKKKDNDNFE